MTNTDVRPLRNGAAWSCDVDERGATGTLPGWRKAGKVIDADNEHLIARQADRAVDVADGTGPASSRTATPGRQSRQARRCFVRQSLRHSRPLPRTPSRGLAAALRGLTQEGLIIIIYDQIQTDDEGVVSQPEYTFEKPSSGPNDRDHLRPPRTSRGPGARGRECALRARGAALGLAHGRLDVAQLVAGLVALRADLRLEPLEVSARDSHRRHFRRRLRPAGRCARRALPQRQFRERREDLLRPASGTRRRGPRASTPRRGYARPRRAPCRRSDLCHCRPPRSLCRGTFVRAPTPGGAPGRPADGGCRRRVRCAGRPEPNAATRSSWSAPLIEDADPPRDEVRQ